MKKLILIAALTGLCCGWQARAERSLTISPRATDHAIMGYSSGGRAGLIRSGLEIPIFFRIFEEPKQLPWKEENS